MARKLLRAIQAAAHEVLLNDPAFLQELVRGVLQRFLEAEMAEHLRAEPHERSEERRGYRNGYKGRQVGTRVGRYQRIATVAGHLHEQIVDLLDSDSLDEQERQELGLRLEHLDSFRKALPKAPQRPA